MLKTGRDIRFHRRGRGIQVWKLAKMLDLPQGVLRAFEHAKCDTPDDILQKAQAIFDAFDREQIADQAAPQAVTP